MLIIPLYQLNMLYPFLMMWLARSCAVAISLTMKMLVYAEYWQGVTHQWRMGGTAKTDISHVPVGPPDSEGPSYLCHKSKLKVYTHKGDYAPYADVEKHCWVSGAIWGVEYKSMDYKDSALADYHIKTHVHIYTGAKSYGIAANELSTS